MRSSNSRFFFAVIGVALSGLSVMGPTPTAKRASGGQPRPALRSTPSTVTRPDVVIVLTDQQRADALGVAGAVDLRTPALDRLAGEGVLFNRAFVATPQCSPSRAALLTGRYPHRTGVMGNTGGEDIAAGRATSLNVSGGRVSSSHTGEGLAVRARAAVQNPRTPSSEDPDRTPAGMSRALDMSVPNIARVFAAVGYETAYFGKWHLGPPPTQYGFAAGSMTRDRMLTERIIEYLRARPARTSRRPLLLFVSYTNPHDIYSVLNAPPPPATALAAVRLPSNLVDDLSQKPLPQRQYLEMDQGKPFVGADRDVWRRYRAFYNGLVESVDREIGTILDELRRSGTPITVFSSDHGDHGGGHGLPYKGPAMYEELVRVPLIITWPGRIRPARSDALVSLMDIVPTLCDLAGVPAPAGIDGLSLRPVLEKRATRVRDMVFGEYYGKQFWRVPIRMVRTERWKYVRYLGHGEELYDLVADPGELRNLAQVSAARSERTRLSRELDAWIKKTQDPFESLGLTEHKPW